MLFILVFASATSQNLDEIRKLQSEYKKVLDRQSLQKSPEITEAEKTASSTALPDKLIYSRKDIESLLVNTEKLLTELKFFEDSVDNMPYIGYEFFEKRDTIPFWQNLPISKNYILGPGDEIIISLWGESNAYNTEIINRDGQIFVENIGVLNIGSKNLLDAKNFLTSKYSKVYSTLLGNNPKSFIDITLGELKSINVHFVGYVNIPGVHMIHPFSNVLTGLIQAGGVNYKGSLREIALYRENEKISTVDLYDYIILGKPSSKMRLMDQDVIHISPRKSTIPLTGRVLSPGYYEILENENLSNLISFSGGYETGSSSSIFLYKNEKSVKSGFIVNKKETDNFEISNGDSIHVPLEPKSSRYIVIQGQIKNPGRYPYNNQTKLNDIIDATMSLDDEEFKATMDLSNVNIYRKNPNEKYPYKINTNVSENILLKNEDLINVPKKYIYEKIESVVITGEVVMPGIYPVNGLTSLGDIINASGGFTEFALSEGVEIFRDSSRVSWEKNTIILEDGDSLNVMKKSGLVYVDGEINRPGYLSFSKNKSLKTYIKKAGGLTAFADENNIFVIYPNGTSVQNSKWFSPKVKEGSIIIISQRTISGKNEMSGWEKFSIVASQAGNIATTFLSLSLILSQNSNGN